MANDISSSIVNLLGIAVLASQLFLLFLVIIFILHRYTKNKNIKFVYSFVQQNAFSFAFFVASGAAVGSLALSEIAHYPPCDLCWFQRIFMYPQVIILGIAVIKNDISSRIYSLSLCAIGIGFAIYHFFLQLYPSILPCTSGGILCSRKSIELFGYMTIPVMSATAFLLIIILMLYTYERKK